jgi:hypothetical protein
MSIKILSDEVLNLILTQDQLILECGIKNYCVKCYYGIYNRDEYFPCMFHNECLPILACGFFQQILAFSRMYIMSFDHNIAQRQGFSINSLY